MNNFLNLKRIGLLARREFLSSWRSRLITAGVVGGVLLIIVLLRSAFGEGSMAYDKYYTAALFIWGAITASTVFQDLHNRNENEEFLLLPASAMEKTIVRILKVSVVFPPLVLMLIGGVSVPAEALSTLFFKTAFIPLDIFKADLWTIMGHVIVLQSVFILGSAWFRKVHFIKTVLALVVLAMGLGIVSSLMIIWRSVPNIHHGVFSTMTVDVDLSAANIFRFGNLERIGKIFYALIVPFCWAVTWLRVKNTQSSDGV